MDEEYHARMLAELEQLVEDAGFGFVVVQERVIAAEGKTLTSNEVSQLDLTPRRPKDRLSKNDVFVRPLDVRSRLELLLDLIEVATVGTAEMERAVVANLGATIIFDSPPEAELRGASVESWTLSEQMAAATPSVAEVAGVLHELRAVTELPRGEWLSPYDRDDDSPSCWREHDDEPGTSSGAQYGAATTGQAQSLAARSVACGSGRGRLPHHSRKRSVRSLPVLAGSSCCRR
ncbi:hypothetical protein [Amycolatopsis sp. NPDC102389]|uniref:hypothetical protein n=1 Tax=Amycolatopsis sp. NPDC102389 TaxID=3363941 RepID=UPI003800AFED